MRCNLWEVIRDIAGLAFVLGFVIMELHYVARIYQLPHNDKFNGVHKRSDIVKLVVVTFFKVHSG